MKPNKKGLKVTKAMREQAAADRAKAKANEEERQQFEKAREEAENAEQAELLKNQAKDDSFAGLLQIEATRTIVAPNPVKLDVMPGQVLNTSLARKSGLHKLVKPTLEQARAFFDWQIAKQPIFRADGSPIDGWNEFRSSKGHTLHIGETYNPVQPLDAFEKTIQAFNEMGVQFNVDGVGSFHNDSQIFAQFVAENKQGFNIKGKDYKGFVTMGKGNDETLPLSYWLTLVCVVCANTWRMARRDRKTGQAVIMKQTKLSNTRLEAIQEEIKALFTLQETVQATLARMAESPVSLVQAERAFLGLLKLGDDIPDTFKQTGKTRLENELERYKMAFRASPGVNDGSTREDWFNAVTWINTQGDKASKNYNADKTELSSEYGQLSKRKQSAFELASDDKQWEGLVASGEQIMAALLNKPVIVAQTSSVGVQDFNRLLAK